MSITLDSIIRHYFNAEFDFTVTLGFIEIVNIVWHLKKLLSRACWSWLASGSASSP